MLAPIAINACLAQPAADFGTSPMAVGRITVHYLPPTAQSADRWWRPEGRLAEVDLSEFRSHPYALAVIGSTPVHVPDTPGCRFFRKALWSARRCGPGWKLTVPAAPHGICIWRSRLVSDLRHGKAHR